MMNVIPVSKRVLSLREMYYNSAVFKESLSYVKIRRQNLTYMRTYIKSQAPTSFLSRAYSEAAVLENMNPVIEQDELIVGKSDFTPLTEDEQKEYKILLENMKIAPQARGIGGHMVLDYPKLLRVGVEGLLSEVREYRSKLNLDENPQTDLEKDEFYEACEAELSALLVLQKKYADHARALAEKELSEKRKAELLEIASVLDRVPAKPARTFREALQSIQFYHFSLWDGFHIGRVDQFLYPYYKADIQSGRLTNEKAMELIDCFRLIAVGYIHPDTAICCLVGGHDKDGNLVENELTEMFLMSLEHIRTMHKVEFAVSKDTSDELLRYAIRLNAMGLTLPSLLNDDVITEGMRMAGYTEEESRNWANTGCVEITPIAKSGIFVVSPYHNMPKMLLEAMKCEVSSFEELFCEFEKILRFEIKKELKTINQYQMERSRNGKEVMRVSCLVDDCIKRGKSIDNGGAVYNHIQPNFLGLANTADSLAAIDELVFKSGQYTLSELCAILEADFDGEEELLSKIINKFPHYGTNNESADKYVILVTDIIKKACAGLKTYRGAELQPGCFSYLEHARHGALTGATPDGRRAYYPLSSGSSPVQGREIDGPTSAILSAVSWDHRPFLGGVAINLKFTPKQMTEESEDKMLSIVKTFINLGGFQLQFNVASGETLKKAMEEPEKYRDLIVRVGGFSANFVKLTPEMQREIIDRNEHSM